MLYLKSLPIRSFSLNTLLISVALTISACSGDEEPGGSAFVSHSADTVTTEVLQRNAATNSSESIGKVLDSMLNTMNNSSAIGRAFSLPGVGITSSEAPSAEGIFNDPTEAGPILNDDFQNRMRTESSTLFSSLMGLSGNPTVTRTGNIVAIDPDENEICQLQTLDGAVALSTCSQLLADLSVRITAETDQSGLISYLFREQVVAEIGYTPVHGSYELKLAGLRSLMNRMLELDATSDSVPETMTGSIKFEATVLNATSDAEAGSFTVSIPDPITIRSDADGTDVQIGQSKILEITADSGRGTASIEMAIGALNFASRSDDLAGSPIQELIMSGLTMRADLTRNGEELALSNVGLANGPLVMTVDSLEALRVTLGTFGYAIDSQNTISLSGNLNLGISLSNVFGVIDQFESHDLAASYNISAPSGTVFSELVNGLLRIDQGGPLNFDYSVNDAGSQTSAQVVVNRGECFGDDYETDSVIAVTECN